MPNEKTKKKVKENVIKVKKVKENETKKVKDKTERKTNDKTKKIDKTKKRKQFIIIDSSSTIEVKEKIDSNSLSDKKTHLKISPEMNSTMNIKPNVRLNESFIDLMEKLASIMMKQGEPFRARAYQKAQETIMSYNEDIISPDDLKGKPHIGATIMEKLNEYVETGTLRILEREKNNPVNLLADIYGIGPKKAKELVDKGITSIEQLRENQQMLNDVQKVGLRYYEDILKRIPRSEIEEYEKIFDTTHKISTVDSQFEIVGSYRRGAKDSGDIDVIITSASPNAFINFINNLITQRIIVEVLSRGPTKCLVITKLGDNPFRRVDFLYTSPEEYPFSVLYFTGSKIFNTVMRHQALTMGLTMNEHGLYKMTSGKKGEKVEHVFTSEKDIFDYLNLEYKTPVERTDGRAVIIKTAMPIPIVEEKIISPLKEKEVQEPIKTDTKQKKKPNKTVKKRFVVEDEEEVKNEIIKPLPVEESNEESDKPLQTLPFVSLDSGNPLQVAPLDPVIKDIINDFKRIGISILEQLNENQLTTIIREASRKYYNSEPIMTDNEYDIIKEFTQQKYPSNKAVHQIGAPIERNKATLPYHMGSMDKIKPDTGILTNWSKKYDGPYILSCKLDGVSGLYTTDGANPKLFTRGDGTVGQDISHLIPYLRLPKTKGIAIRGEFIIPKAVFEAKYKTTFANPRNMVAGICNHKTVNDAVKDLSFVAYEVIVPSLKPSDQMDYLATIDVERVLYKTVTTVTNEMLSETLVDWRTNYLYEIDGVIVTNDGIYERKLGNPDHAFAFKMVLSDQIAEAKVVDVIWTPSKDGYLKPRVQIEPINLGGVRIEYATGFNGSFINNNKIGVGAVIELIRSGDVIPYIRKITAPAEYAKMPLVPFKWNDTHIDILLEDMESDETVKEKVVTGFFRGIGVEGLSSGNVARIIQAGYDTVPKILKMTVENLLEVEGFKMKMATKVHNGIKERLNAASLVTIMSATNIFGRGFNEKKLELIMSGYPDVLVSKESNEVKIERIVQIKGMARKTAEAFVVNIPEFLEFLIEAGLSDKLSQAGKTDIIVDESHPLFGKTVVMTGFRDAELQEWLKTKGAKLGSSISKNTFLVVVKDDIEETGKTLEAKKLGIPIMTVVVFRQTYLV